MAKVTIVFGVALIALGIGFFVATGSAAPTSLIPAYFGAVLAICGLLANSPEPGRRMLWMHIAVTIGLVGFIFPAARTIMAFAKAHGGPVSRPIAVAEQGTMAVVCLIFVLLCVRSFIAARRAREA